MNLRLVRKDFRQAGIFGQLWTEDKWLLAVTLEHAYQDGSNWVPKVASGIYTCLRHAPNRLPYETFELQGVPDFQGAPVSGILIHCGNFDKDSEGCILVGQAESADMITNSRDTFAKLMSLQHGLNEFQLTISNY